MWELDERAALESRAPGVLFSVVLSAAKDLTPAMRPLSDHSVRSFAALRMTGMNVDAFLHVLSVRDETSPVNFLVLNGDSFLSS